MPWRTFVARCLTVGAIVGAFVAAAAFFGVKLAVADPGGPTRSELTFSGVLRDRAGALVNGPVTFTFAFRKGSGTPPPVVCSVAASETMVTNGAFTVGIPLASCPRQLFDGSDIFYDVYGLGEVAPIVSNVAITPVPYARFADQVGVNNDCPAGYARSDDAGDAPFTVCRRTLGGGRFDEVVKVGFGASAFWIDRYEASVWDNAATTGMRLFRNFDSTSADFPKSGQWRSPGRTSTVRSPLPTPPAYAWSVRGVMPSSNVTWFQAQEACAASGKALPTRDEWLRAAQSTEDPGDVPWVDGSCRNNRGSLGAVPRDTGLGALCRSGWGAQDMIGNLWEWTDEWYASIGQTTSRVDPRGGGIAATSADRAGEELRGIRVNDGLRPWPASYGDGMDGTWNVASTADGERSPVSGIPSAASRGGSWDDGVRAGVFALLLHRAPTNWDVNFGFRCMIPR